MKKISEKFTRSERRASGQEQTKPVISDHVARANHVINWEESKNIKHLISATDLTLVVSTHIWYTSSEVGTFFSITLLTGLNLVSTFHHLATVMALF